MISLFTCGRTRKFIMRSPLKTAVKTAKKLVLVTAAAVAFNGCTPRPSSNVFFLRNKIDSIQAEINKKDSTIKTIDMCIVKYSAKADSARKSGSPVAKPLAELCDDMVAAQEGLKSVKEMNKDFDSISLGYIKNQLAIAEKLDKLERRSKLLKYCLYACLACGMTFPLAMAAVLINRSRKKSAELEKETPA